MLSELINDEKTRTFLTFEVGAGHHEVSLQLFELSTHLTHSRSFVPCPMLSLLPCKQSASKDITPTLDSMHLLPGPFFIGRKSLKS